VRYVDLTTVGLERAHNFSDMARTLLMGESNFLLPCDFKELRVAKRAHISTSALSARWEPLLRIGPNRYFQNPEAVQRNFFALALYNTCDHCGSCDGTTLVIRKPFTMWMSPRYGFGAHHVFVDRSRDHTTILGLLTCSCFAVDALSLARLSLAHSRRTPQRALPRERFSRVLGMFSSLEVKVLYST